jgi:hypothetical protein
MNSGNELTDALASCRDLSRALQKLAEQNNQLRRKVKQLLHREQVLMCQIQQEIELQGRHT